MRKSSLFTTQIQTENDAKLYTGITLSALHTLIQCMEPYKNMAFEKTHADQILMTLMKLKLNLLQADLAKRFDCSPSSVSRIINYCIDKLAQHMSDLMFWLPRETIRATMPESFKSKYPKTTCVLDCAETLLEKPSNLDSRGETYSNYKSHNTCKYTRSPFGTWVSGLPRVTQDHTHNAHCPKRGCVSPNARTPHKTSRTLLHWSQLGASSSGKYFASEYQTFVMSLADSRRPGFLTEETSFSGFGKNPPSYRPGKHHFLAQQNPV